MEYASLAASFEEFQKHRTECAYVHRRGYRTERWSYGDVYDRAVALAKELRERGLGKGERALLWGENCAEWVAAFFGCVLAGVVVVPMDDAALPDFAQRVLRQVHAKAILCSRKHSAEYGQPTLILEEMGKSTRPGPQFSGPELNASDVLQIVFTSGTTAEPKGVVITHGNVMANVQPLEREIRKYLKYERWAHPIRFLNLLPLSHVFGQFLALYLPPIMAGTVIFQSTLNPTDVMETIRRERVSVLVAVPRMLQSLRERIEAQWSVDSERFRQKLAQAADKHYLSRWWMFRDVHRRFGPKFWACICGGAALDQETEEFWRRLGFAVIQGYGLTETTSLISVNHPFRLGRGSIGKVLPGREIKLAEDGEILVRGGGVASARWSEGTLQPITEEEGWYRTGDVGALDAEGNLYFRGRKKETIVTAAGMNVYPEDLEAALRAQPEIKDCVVVPVARDGNEEPCAVLLLRAGAEQASAAVDRANRGLAEYQRIRLWHVWPEPDFPRTSTQKPRRQLVRQIIEKRLESSDQSNRNTESVAALIHKIAGRTPAELGLDLRLGEDLKLSSLERVELLSALEERYQVDLSETRFSQAASVGEIAELLHGEQALGRRYHYPNWTLSWPITWIRFAAFYLLVRPAVLLLGWPKIVGRENLKNVSGPVLVISNHIDDVDVGFIQTALPTRLRHRLATGAGGEALEILRTPEVGVGWWSKIFRRVEWFLGVSLLNLFPLPREAGFRRSFAYAGEAVDRGYSVLVFPEGRHTTDGKMNPFRSGVGLLSKNLGIPVLPMRIDGLFEVKKAGKKFAFPGQIQVRMGGPLLFPRDSKPEEIAAKLQKAVMEL